MSRLWGPLVKRIAKTDALCAVILIRLAVGSVFLSEGIQKFPVPRRPRWRAVAPDVEQARDNGNSHTGLENSRIFKKLDD